MKKVKEATAQQPLREPMTPAQRIRADWKSLMGRVSYFSLLTNIPYLAFLALLVVVYIANSHRAVELQRDYARQQQILKELHWRYMDAKTKLMSASTETEIIRQSEPYGLKPLRLPAYSIVVKK